MRSLLCVNSKRLEKMTYEYGLFGAYVASGEGAVRQTPKIARFCLPESLVDGLPEYCRGRA